MQAWPASQRQWVKLKGGVVLITADHGNCEMMRDPETGGPHTSHTTNPVPLLLVGITPASRSRGANWRMSGLRCSP